MRGQAILYTVDPTTGVTIPISAITDPVSGATLLRAAMYALSPAGEQVELVSAHRANLAATSANHALMVTPPGDWAVTVAPAAGVQAVLTRAGVPGTRQVLHCVTASMASTGAAIAALQVQVLDGATMVYSFFMACLAATSQTVHLPGLNIVGSDGASLTVQFNVGPGVGNFQSASMSGTDVTA